MEVLSRGGISKGATTSSASTWPRASRRGFRSIGRRAKKARMRSRASSTLIMDEAGKVMKTLANSRQADGETGGGALDPGDLLDGVGDGISKPIEVIGFELDDDVVGAGHGIDDDYAGTGVLEIADGCADGFGLADIGLNKDVTADGHAKSSGPGFLPEGWGSFGIMVGRGVPCQVG